MPLSATQMAEAWQAIAAWQAKPDDPVICPQCGTDGVVVADRSARPHAEWYALSCKTCGLDETLHRSMPSPYMGLD